MQALSEQSSSSNVDGFRDSVIDGDMSALNAALDVLADAHFSTDERDLAKSSLLMLCVQCYPARVDAAIDILLSSGAHPGLQVEHPERDLAGMRAGMHCINLTPVGQAIDNGDPQVYKALLLAALARGNEQGSSSGVPNAGFLRVDGTAGAYQCNVLAFASACGQSELLDWTLGQLDAHNSAVRRAMGEAVDSLLAAGMLHQGPDGVLRDIVTLIGRGATLSRFAIEELSLREIRLDSGSLGGTFAKYAPFAALAIASALPEIGADVEDVVLTLHRLAEECEVDLSSIELPHFPGASLFSVADLVGSRAISSSLLELGVFHQPVHRIARAPLSRDEVLGNVCYGQPVETTNEGRRGYISPHLEPAKQETVADSAVGAKLDKTATSADLFWSLRAAQQARHRASGAPSPGRY